MWNRPTRGAWVAVASCLLCAAASGVAPVAHAEPDDPGGKGAEIVRAKCVSCHQMDMIRQQRLTSTGWQREVDKMIRWGAPLTDDERDLLVEYLTSTPDLNARGAEILRQRCLGCHQADMVEQQRLGTAAWAREIDKMIRWGASVPATEKDTLVGYLSKRFGPR